MTTKEIRKEINRVIQEIPENFLEDILSYLRQIEKKSKNDIETLSNLKRIFKEDQELLEKLAK
jgi:site-specific recombinase